ncbi:hypothetical protein LWF15_19615 [Kineosporia rhizophila]|nr:hypothetical protein [Kineosporia sp. NBRC 101677]MCE0537703.1 hypothetical protein [Kineosporia rhizophila]GLY14898.1 hypothetical protein Kisp01_19130 [Kineosporia sp. NBRC 101677]
MGIEVSNEPLSSPWSTNYYRRFGPDYPPEGSGPLTRQVVRSAFELPFPASVPAGPQVLTGRSWSGGGRIRHVEVSTDGASWRRAIPHGPSARDGWSRWSIPWRPSAGSYEVRARAVDEHGNTQPEVAEFNSFGYLFDAVVKHPVTVV